MCKFVIFLEFLTAYCNFAFDIYFVEIFWQYCARPPKKFALTFFLLAFAFKYVVTTVRFFATEVFTFKLKNFVFRTTFKLKICFLQFFQNFKGTATVTLHGACCAIPKRFVYIFLLYRMPIIAILVMHAALSEYLFTVAFATTFASLPTPID